MIAAFWGTLAGVLVLLVYAVVQALFYLIDKPDPGTRAKPPRARHRERRQAERARDAATERLFAGMEVPPEIARDAMPAGILRYDGPDLTSQQLREFGQSLAAPLHLAAGPLMPLPPEVVGGHTIVSLACFQDVHDRCEAERCDCPCHQPEVAADLAAFLDDHADCPDCGDDPEDPHDVASGEQEADAYVGDLGPAELPEPEPAPLTDYRDETGTWLAIRDDVMAEAGGEK